MVLSMISVLVDVSGKAVPTLVEGLHDCDLRFSEDRLTIARLTFWEGFALAKPA